MILDDSKILLSALKGEAVSRPPFWFMRQAGRYLPEYRALREKAGGFLEMVYNPDLAVEITLQPIRRFGMDAAILFSDILVVPHAMGRDLRFEQGEGPVLNPLSAPEIGGLCVEGVDGFCAPVYETLRRVKSGLRLEGFSGTTLIGFAGAPWTVACYMVQGGGSRDFETVRRLALSDPESFQTLIDRVVEATVIYLRGQIRAGAEAVQIFDSWAGLVDAQNFKRWAIDPVNAIVRTIGAEFPGVPVIGFPRGAGTNYEAYVATCDVQAIGIDSGVSTLWAREHLQPHKVVQGNLDPLVLLQGGDEMERAVLSILSDLAGRPFVFNLGHGIIKETPPHHVDRLCRILRERGA